MRLRRPVRPALRARAGGGAARGLPEALDDPDAAGTSQAGGDAAAGHPFYASSELVAALTRPPEREMPGIRLTLRPDFDVAQEPAAGRAAITVGEILDRNRRPARWRSRSTR